jgi:spermidine synthase
MQRAHSQALKVSDSTSLRAFYLLSFFFSGFAALLYQVVWQRALFGVFGIDAESLTIVVTSFMLGLGIGSLIGGAFSGLPSRHLILMFAGIEGLIGVFGFFSLDLFHWVGAMTLQSERWVTALATFALLLVPTLLMGASLPILFGYSVGLNHNAGRSAGFLYFANTLGSALAALCAVMFVMKYRGLSGSLDIAAAINMLVALVVVLCAFVTRGEV